MHYSEPHNPLTDQQTLKGACNLTFSLLNKLGFEKSALLFEKEALAIYKRVVTDLDLSCDEIEQMVRNALANKTVPVREKIKKHKPAKRAEGEEQAIISQIVVEPVEQEPKPSTREERKEDSESSKLESTLSSFTSEPSEPKKEKTESSELDYTLSSFSSTTDASEKQAKCPETDTKPQEDVREEEKHEETASTSDPSYSNSSDDFEVSSREEARAAFMEE